MECCPKKPDGTRRMVLCGTWTNRVGFFNEKKKVQEGECCEDYYAMPKIHKSHENGVGGVGLVRINKKK